MKILFVDDEQNVLQGLRRSLRSIRREHEMTFVASGQEAVDLFSSESQPFDLIVSDMRMPGMDGAELLQYIKNKYPNVFRFALSGGTEIEMQYKTTHLAHQFLSKPCDAKALKSAIDNAASLIQMMQSKPLQKILSRMSSIPSMPAAYEHLQAELNKEEPSMKQVSETINQDLGMTAKILQLVNSAFFGVAYTITKPEQAVTLLGLDTIKSLVLSIGIFSLFEPDLFPEFSFENLWQHGTVVGAAANAIAKAEKYDKQGTDEAMMAGLLHDAGKLVLATNLPVRYRDTISKAQQNQNTLWQMENECLGTTHAVVGAYVLGIWGLPQPIVEAIAFHHNPSMHSQEEMSCLTIVHAANAFANEYYNQDQHLDDAHLDEAYIDRLGLTDRVQQWREICVSLFEKEKMTDG